MDPIVSRLADMRKKERSIIMPVHANITTAHPATQMSEGKARYGLRCYFHSEEEYKNRKKKVVPSDNDEYEDFSYDSKELADQKYKEKLPDYDHIEKNY